MGTKGEFRLNRNFLTLAFIICFKSVASVQAESLDPPSAPVNFHGTALSPTEILWTWDSSESASFYTLNRSPSGTLINQTTETQFTEKGLQPNEPLNRILRAANANGISGPTTSQTVYTLAAIPANIKAENVGLSYVELHWSSRGNSAYTRYKLERSKEGTSFVAVPRLTASLQYYDMELEHNTPYFYRIKAINGAGVSSAYSSVFLVKTSKILDSLPPDKPHGLKGNLDFSGKVVTLMWEPVDQNVDGTRATDIMGYNIYRRSSLKGTRTRLTEVPVTSRVFADVVGGQTFYYTVRALDSSENESVDSLIVDSSPETNVIFLAGDGYTSVVMPGSVNALLRPQGNRYGVPLDITLREDPVPSKTSMVRNVTLQFVRGDTREKVNNLAFALPQVVVNIGYNQIGGKVAKGAPNAQGGSFPVVPESTPDQLSIHWNNGGTWVKVGGTLNLEAQVMSIKSSYLGSFQLHTVPRAPSLALAKKNVYPAVITPNGDGRNDRLFINLDNPQGVEVKGEVYDLTGTYISALQRRSRAGGMGTTLTWAGNDSKGSIVPGGTYIYRIKGEGQSFTGTVGVAR